jgi:hypothetical protein
MDKDKFIGIGILIKRIGLRLLWRGKDNAAVTICKDCFPALEVIFFGFYLEPPEPVRLYIVCLRDLRGYTILLFYFPNLRRAMFMIDIAVHPVETNSTEELL